MNTFEKILQVSLDLFIDKGLQSTSTKLILETANISTGALYHHFSNKDEIALELYKALNNNLIDEIYNNTYDTVQFRDFLQKYWITSIKWCMKHPKEKLFMEMYGKQPSVGKQCQPIINEKTQFIADKADEAIRSHIIDVPDCRYLLYTFNATLDAIIDYLRVEPHSYTEEFIEFCFNKYWRSIANF